MNLQSRVEKLEQATGAAGGCPECGYVEGALVTFTITPGEVFDEQKPFKPTRQPPPQKRCATCGRVTHFTFTIEPAGREDEFDYAEEERA